MGYYPGHVSSVGTMAMVAGYISLGIIMAMVVTSRVPINKSIRPRDEVIMMNNDETYDEIMM